MADRDGSSPGVTPTPSTLSLIDKKIGHRIRVRREMLQQSPDELAARTSLSTELLQHYEEGRQRCPAELLAAIAVELRVATSWFLADLGQLGQPLPTKPTQLIPAACSTDEASLQEEHQLIAAFAQISSPQLRQSLIRIAQSMANTQPDEPA